jgi:7-cyano-7-deazaguanine reductase
MAEGLTLLGDNRAPYRGLESFPAPPGMDRVVMTSDEVTAICPVTGQPDWYAVTITYRPRLRCLESKSLKLYLHSFRDRGLFCEALARRACDDVAEALDPRSCAVAVRQKPRGGVAIEAVAAWPIPQ